MDPILLPLNCVEIHGFRTLADLDITKLRDHASTRWFRPNEVYAILTNPKHFTIQPQPLEHPTNGSFVLFDRKMLRNFRKDGYSWKKKKDGKTVQEAHEKLKIGNEERIHVYYARGVDDPNFYRRCYWLLDKNLEHIVLVHYRQIIEQDNASPNVYNLVECREISYIERKMQACSPITPMNSTVHSDFSGSAVLTEEFNSREDQSISAGSGVFVSNKQFGHQISKLCLEDIIGLDWEKLAHASEYIEPCMERSGALVSDEALHYKSSTNIYGQGRTGHAETPNNQEILSVLLKASNHKLKPVVASEEPKIFVDDIFSGQNGFGQWDNLKDDSFCTSHVPLISDGNRSNSFMAMDYSSGPTQIFTINEVSPGWGYSSEETKVVVIGTFSESHRHLKNSSIYCVFGELCVNTEIIQPGVYRCIALPQIPGTVDLFLTCDGHTPISQVLTFNYRHLPVAQLDNEATLKDDIEKTKCKDVMVQKRLAHLLFSTSDYISFSNKLLPKAIKDSKKFALLTSPHIETDWFGLLKLDCKNDIQSYQAYENLLELMFKNKLQEWLIEKIAQGYRTTARDSQGQGAIHLCTILDYTWAISLFSLSGFSLDFRDAYGWTALHWAAYLGRVRMVATLLSAGANPSLVTDPTPEIPGGFTAADLASKGGHDGLAAYLAEKGLTAHFESMSLCGNIPSSISLASKDQANPEDPYSGILSEQEVCLKESLAAYRNAAEAADRIQAAFRERALKLQTEAIQMDKSEMEASQIVAALRIQHAYRNHSRRKLMKAAARIQSHFRTWQARKDFLNMRRQAVKIQSVFRGHQVRKQHRKIIWSVGVVEKAILRWRMKRKGLRGIQVQVMNVSAVKDESENSVTVEEEFFKISRKQAEDRVQRSVIRVQAMFRSYQAQQEYRRMKLAHEEAKRNFGVLDGCASSGTL